MKKIFLALATLFVAQGAFANMNCKGTHKAWSLQFDTNPETKKIEVYQILKNNFVSPATVELVEATLSPNRFVAQVLLDGQVVNIKTFHNSSTISPLYIGYIELNDDFDTAICRPN